MFLDQARPVTPEDFYKKLADMEKAQIIRAADVLVIGPSMLYAGYGKDMPKWLKALMVFVGVGTIMYNANNYIQIEKLKRDLGIQ
ncbi:MAG: hypothetical protein V3U02_12535 [Calditrichia bacterium]